jgi:hypothetical protein
MAGLIILGLILLAHVIIIAKSGVRGLVATYIIATVIWVFYPGYDSGFASWIATDLVIVMLVAVGSLFPNSPTGVIVAGIGGYIIGRNIAKL